jgi:type IV pilus assembly protein PilQ
MVWVMVLVCGPVAVGWAEDTQEAGSSEAVQDATPSEETPSWSQPDGASQATESSSSQDVAGTPAAAETAAEPPSLMADEETGVSAEDAALQQERELGETQVTETPGAPGLISVDFKDADIRQVLRIISLKSGVDIVAGNDVEGLVTIKLTNVPWEQALDVMLRTYGFTYDRKGNIVRVMTIGALEQEALTTEVFPLDYAKAKEVPEIVSEILSDRGRVKFDERTNTVIVTDIPASLFQVKQVIERLDQRTPQVLIETKVVETKLTRDEKLGIDWSDSFTLSTSAVSLPTTFPFPGGSDFGLLGEFIPRAGAFSPSTGAVLSKGKVPEYGGTVTFGAISSTALSAVMNFLKSRTDTRISSNPSISALNNQQAKIHIGSEFPVPNYTVDPSTGRTTITGYTSKSIGTVLTVTPHVNPSGEIVVDLRPEVTTFAGNRTYDTGGGFAVGLPEFTTQTAQTQVRIRNAETIAIGGLIKETATETVTKVPLLGDLPVIGSLFTTTSKYGSSDPVRQDLLIFVTVNLTEEVAREQVALGASAPTTQNW